LRKSGSELRENKWLRSLKERSPGLKGKKSCQVVVPQNCFGARKSTRRKKKATIEGKRNQENGGTFRAPWRNKLGLGRSTLRKRELAYSGGTLWKKCANGPRGRRKPPPPELRKKKEGESRGGALSQRRRSKTKKKRNLAKKRKNKNSPTGPSDLEGGSLKERPATEKRTGGKFCK